MNIQELIQHSFEDMQEKLKHVDSNHIKFVLTTFSYINTVEEIKVALFDKF